MRPWVGRLPSRMTWQVKVDVTCAGEPHVSASFSRSPITLGAHTENDIVLSAPHISQHHAEVVVSKGGLVLRDTSRNGCFVDGRRVGAELALGDGSVIGVPPFQIEITYEGEEPLWQTAYRDLAHLVPPSPEVTPEVTPESFADASVLPTVHPESNPTPTAPLPIVSASALATKRTLSKPPTPKPKATLEVVEGTEALLGRIFELPAGRMLLVGRGAHAAVVLPHRTVSRRHAEMIHRGDTLAVRDLGSANGVWVNDKRITTARVGSGERIAFGEVVLQVKTSSGTTDALKTRLEATAHPIGDHDDRLLLTLRGAAIGAHRRTLGRALEVVDDDRIRGLVIDLSSVDTIGPSALSLIAETGVSLETRGGTMIVAGTGRAVTKALAGHPYGKQLRERMVVDGAAGITLLARLL